RQGAIPVPTDVKAGVSAVALIVAAVLAFWSGSPIRPELSIFVIITAVFMVAAMWGFPEAGVKKGDVKKAKELVPLARPTAAAPIAPSDVLERSFCAGVSLSAAIRAAKGRQGCRRDPRRGIPPRGWAVFS